MNENVTPTKERGMEDVVNDGARYFEDFEAKLEKDHNRILKLAPIWKEANQLGMMGALETGELISETWAIAGIIAEARMRIYRLHQRGTVIAQKNNVDLPVPKGGGGGR